MAAYRVIVTCKTQPDNDGYVRSERATWETTGEHMEEMLRRAQGWAFQFLEDSRADYIASVEIIRGEG